ncbi:MAG TPA: hypothetical protein VM845_12190 [Burkholderiaceae bacterium]|nr:hypothetical protein [Burkholderiaceae bacterium]
MTHRTDARTIERPVGVAWVAPGPTTFAQAGVEPQILDGSVRPF